MYDRLRDGQPRSGRQARYGVAGVGDRRTRSFASADPSGAPGVAHIPTLWKFIGENRSLQKMSKIAPYVLPIGITLAFVLFCVFLAKTLNIWQDEAYSLHTTASGVADALKRGIGFEAQAPLYFVFLALWRSLGVSVVHARLLSVGFSLVTLYCSWDFARRYVRVSPSIVLAAVAFNPFVVWAAVEIRPYAASIACSAILLLLFFRGFVDTKPSSPARVAFLVVAAIGTYTQYYVASLVPACSLALIVLRRWKVLRSYIAVCAVFGLTLVPLAYVLPMQLHAYDAFAVAFKIPGYVMATVLLEYPFSHEWIGTWVHARALNAVYLAIVAVPVAILAASLRSLGSTTKALLAIVVALFGFYTAVIAIAHVHVLIPRHSLVILVPYTLLVFAAIGDAIPARRRIVLASYTSVFALLALVTYWHTYHNLSKTGDWQRVAAFVQREAKPEDAVAVFNAEAELPFRYYFKARNEIRAIPHPMSFQSFDEETFVLHSEDDVALSLEPIAKNHGRVWLVESNVCARGSAFFGCDYLTSYIRSHFVLLGTTAFDGSTVFELGRPVTAFR